MPKFPVLLVFALCASVLHVYATERGLHPLAEEDAQTKDEELPDYKIQMQISSNF